MHSIEGSHLRSYESGKQGKVSVSTKSRQRTGVLALAATFLAFLATFLALFGALSFLTTLLASLTLRMAAVCII